MLGRHYESAQRGLAKRNPPICQVEAAGYAFG
jgi:hypothetical protein